MECLNDVKKQRHNEISKLCERRRREWKKISKIFLEILLEDKTYKVYKTDEEKKEIVLNRAKEWIINNRERYNSNMLKCMNNKYRWKSISNNFRKILI